MMMLSLTGPGKTMHSTVVVPRDTPPQCDNKFSLLCQRPKYSKRWRDWVLPETKEDAKKRWMVIAHAIAHVSRTTEHWGGGSQSLAQHLVTIAYHESGFGRDSHAGVRRGDCNGQGKRCRSSCLGQILVGTGKSHFTGYTHEQLVGLDEASTRRCVETMARYLVSAQTTCGRKWAPTSATGSMCWFGLYGGVRDPTTDKRIWARVRTLGKLRARSGPPGSSATGLNTSVPASSPR